MSQSLVALLHVCDSLFPIGSFSHSDGLEAATTWQQVQTVAELGRWLEAVLADTLCRLEGPCVSQAWTAWSDHRLDVVLEIDDDLHAIRPALAGREASRAMGTRLLTTWATIRAESVLPRLPAEHRRLTLPVAFGVVASAAGIPAADAIQGFMYTRLASTVSAAMRLMALGQHDGHRLLAEVLQRVPFAADEILRDDRPMTSFAPILDIAAMSQQYVHSRLFRS